MMHVIRNALNIYADREKWQKIVKSSMLSDFSWNLSAKKYIDIYNGLL